MPNTYTHDGSAIIDASGKQWPVNVPHPLPLPDGIAAEEDDRCCIEGLGNQRILFGGDGGGQFKQPVWGLDDKKDTHWLARAPLPPVPRPKTQHELDVEFVEKIRSEHGAGWTELGWRDVLRIVEKTLSYARKEAK